LTAHIFVVPTFAHTPYTKNTCLLLPFLPPSFQMDFLSYPSEARNHSNLLTAETLGDEWRTVAYDREFPFPAGARVATKQHGRGRQLIEIGLDADEKKFVFQHAGERTTCDTPTSILRVIAQTTRLITEGDASSRNWGGIFVTLDNGAHWVKGYELRRFHALRHMRERNVTVRRDMPA
jgi:hypothetical protein